MALLKKSSPSASAPAGAPTFEADPGDTVADVANDTPEAPKTTEVAVRPAAPTTVTVSTSVRSNKLTDVLGELKNTLPVDYNTLANLQVNQGSWLVKETKVSLGDTVEFELLSFQDQFVISPGENSDEAAATVRYSKDGVTCDSGENCAEYLANLRQVYPEASKKPRCVLVLNLTNTSKVGTEGLCDKLYQVDLSQTSKAKFDTFRHQSSFDVSRGKRTADQAVKIRSAVSSVTKGKLTWSVADFTYAD
jgi:hypothetical protein